MSTPDHRISSEDDQDLLDNLQRSAFKYFLDYTNPRNGLVADSTWENAPASIAAAGFGLAAYLVGIVRGWITREEGAERTLATLRFFAESHQGPEIDATGFHGFYYHFLDMQSGERAKDCELSTIDTSILITGALASTIYFDLNIPADREIRRLADSLYRRVNWNWAQDGELAVRHGWRPASGFLEHRWLGYDEALLLYILGLGSSDHPLPPESYQAYTTTYRWEKHYGIVFLYAAPLFIHHFSHIWINFHDIQDHAMREKGLDYFENSRRATYAHQQHAIQNPMGHKGYGEFTWGITASEGPIQGSAPVDKNGQRYYGYMARGIPEPDDGTLSPWTAITSLPFAPEIAVPTIKEYYARYPQLVGEYGLKCSLNPGYPADNQETSGWFSNHYYGINEGPIILMIENYRTGLIWRLMQRSPYLVEGMRRAGFRAGWIDQTGLNFRAT